MSTPGVTPSPYNQLPIPDIDFENWGDEAQNCWLKLDELLGVIAGIGNYDQTSRKRLEQIIGTVPLNTNTKTLIGAINEVLAQAGGPLTGLNDDDFNSVKLSDAATLVEAINRLDGIGYRQVVLEPTSAVKLTNNITGVTISVTSPQIVAGLTAAGIGELTYYPLTQELGFRPYNQVEGTHVYVGAGGTHLLVGDPNTVPGGIYVDVVAGSLPLTSQVDQVELKATTIDIDDSVFGGIAIVVTDAVQPDQIHAYGVDTVLFEYGELTVTNNNPTPGNARITTSKTSGFLGTSAEVYYCRLDAQDSVRKGLEAFIQALLVYNATFTIDTVKVGVLPGSATTIVQGLGVLEADLTSFKGEIVREEIVVTGLSANLNVTSAIGDLEGKALVVCFDTAIVPTQMYLPEDKTKFSFGGVIVSGGTTVTNDITNWGGGNAGTVIVYYCKDGASDFAKEAFRGFQESTFAREAILNGNLTDIPLPNQSLLGAIISLSGMVGGGVTSLNSQTGALGITSPDSSIIVGLLGANITLQTDLDSVMAGGNVVIGKSIQFQDGSGNNIFAIVDPLGTPTIYIGDAALQVDGSIQGHLLPGTPDVFDLGNGGQTWKRVFSLEGIQMMAGGTADGIWLRPAAFGITGLEIIDVPYVNGTSTMAVWQGIPSPGDALVWNVGGYWEPGAGGGGGNPTSHEQLTPPAASFFTAFNYVSGSLIVFKNGLAQPPSNITEGPGANEFSFVAGNPLITDTLSVAYTPA